MRLTINLMIRFVLSTIRKNFLNSLAIVFFIILVLSSTIAILGWLEASPKISIERAFKNRVFEIEVSEIYYQPNALNILQVFFSGYFYTLGLLITSHQVTDGPYDVFLLESTFSPIVLALALSMVAVIIIVAAVIPLKKIFSLKITIILRGE